MRVVVAIALVLAIALAVTASSKQTPVRKTLSSLPHGWHKAARASPKQMINVVFAVKQRNLDTLEDWVLKVSNPDSAFFGRHLSMDTVNKMTTNAAGLAKVHIFLRSAGLERTAITLFPNNFVRARMSVAMAERILNTEFHHFVHRQAKKKVLRAEAYTIPHELSESVQFVSVLHFPSSRPAPMMAPLSDEAVRALAASNFTDFPPGYTTPQVLYTYYGVSNPKVSNTKATQSLYESLDQSYSPADLTQFQNTFNLVANPITKVIGPNVPTACAQDPNNCVEANLDVQYIMAIAQNSPTWFWSIASSDQHPWIDWLVAVGNDANAPLVHSVSYGDIEPMGDVDEMTRFNDEAMKLAARGITVVIASGDDGVANFIARNNASACGFTPSFPATAQYVTAVGATMGPENSTAEIAETSDAGGGITTGGGFSTVFNQPSYQASAVSAYLSNPNVNLPPTSQFNPSGRGYPDVSMIGHNYIIYDGGQPSGGSGTSASAPVFAGMITLINADRMNAGKSPLGFLNQILYKFAVSNPNVYNDITQGTNNCCAGDPGSQVCCQYGFTATTGWDPLTGLGSIHYQAFHDACLALN